MTATVDQFVKQATSHGILDAEELRAFVDRLPPAKRTASGDELARLLVQGGKLTKFQAQCIWQGKAKALVLGEYIVLDKLGAGGMGQVYKAQHRRMKRLVAIKVLPAAATKSADLVKRFQREVEAAARLNHPNIVAAYDASEHHGTYFLVMEFVDGRDLSYLVKQGGPLPVNQAVDYLLQAARGLAYAHQKGVVHRDIKPGNLLVDTEGRVKILDMGLARFEDALATDRDGGGEGLTQSGQIMGTVDYMAPEQALNTHTADGRADIYSLGCTLYRLLTGANAFEGQSVLEKILAHRDKPTPSLTAARPDVSARLDAVFQKMMAKQPEERYQSMNDVITALESLAQGQAPVAAPGVSATSDANLTEFFAGLESPSNSTDRNTGATLITEAAKKSAATKPAPSAAASHRQAKSRRPLMLAGGGVAALLLIGVLAAALRSSGQPDATTAVVTEANSNSSSAVTVPATSDEPEIAQQPTDEPSAPDSLVPGEPIDLLTRIDLERDVLTPHPQPEENWRWEQPSTALITSRNSRPAPRLQLPVEAIPPQYDLAMTLTRRVDAPGLFLSFPFGGYWGGLGMDNAKHAWGLGLIDGRNSEQNSTSVTDLPMEIGQPTEVVLQVRENAVSVLVNGNKIISWSGSPARFTAPNNWDVEGPARFILSSAAPFTLTRLTLTPWTPSIDATSSLTSTSASTPAAADSDPTWPAESVDGPNYALSFDGVNSRFTIPGLNVEGWEAYTAEAWVEPRTIARAMVICANPFDLFLIPENQQGPPGFRLQAELSGRKFNSAYALGTAQAHQRVHVAGVWTGSQKVLGDGNELHIFVNGKRGGWTSLDAALDVPATFGLIGCAYVDNEMRFDGLIDEVRISKSVRYTEDFTPSARFEDDDHTEVLYHFDDGAGEVAADASGNGYNGRVINATWVRLDAGAQPTPPAADASAVPAGEPIDLLARIDLQRDVMVGKSQGDWRWEQSGVLLTPGRDVNGPRIALPVDDLPEEYEIAMTAERRGKSITGLMLAFVIDGHWGMLRMDGDDRSDWGLYQLDGRPPETNGTAVEKPQLAVGESFEVILRVRRNQVTVLRNGKQIVDWNGDPSSFSLPTSWSSEGPPRLFLGSMAIFAVTKLTLTPLSSPTTAPLAEPPTAVEPIDLMARIDLERDFFGAADSSSWRLDGKMLVTSPQSGVRLPVDPVPEEYDVSWTMERQSSWPGLRLTFVMGGHQGTLLIDGGSYSWGLDMIDGSDVRNNGTLVTSPRRYPADVLVQVRRNRVTAWRNRQMVLEWTGDPARFSLDERYTYTEKPPPGLFMTTGAEFTISNLKLTPVSTPTSAPLTP